jgi:hypothetical protein
MTSKQWTLVALAVILGGVSLYLNKDWFSRDNIQIYHRSSPRPQLFRRAQPSSLPSLPINFGFSHSLELKNLKVLVVAEAATNKYPRPIWHLTSESNSVATKTFLYGMNIRGMHPAVKGATPAVLLPGERYRLVVEAKNFEGEHEFIPLPRQP